MDETADKPKWLLELENRKRKPRLAHEAGAGAACLICNAACPGLDLHFWRKICKNCKCSRDDHDVNDDDFPQFDLLFGPTGKFKKKAMLLQVPNKKQHEAETAFDWVPPDTTKELAADYMNALPKDKLPIKGSAGAALRRQLLQKQLPLHDIDQKACNNLSDEEKKQFGKYLENLKKCVGQGKVTKILGARPFNRALMTPANATDMHRLSPQQKSPSAPAAHLRTPSSFNPKITQTLHSKIPYNSDNEQNPDTNQNPACNASVKANAQVPERHNGVLSAISNNRDIANSEQLQQGAYGNPQYSNIFVSPRKPNQPPTSREQSGTNAPNHQTNSVESSHPQPESAMPINHPTVRTLPHCQVACSEKCSCQVPSESAMFSVRHETNLPCPNNCNDPQVCPSLANVPQESVRAQNYRDTVKGPLSSLVRSENVNPEDALAAETMLANALLPPSAVHSGDIIGSTLDEKGLTYIREKLSNKYSMQENQVPPNVIPSEAEVLLKKRSVAKQDDAASSNKEAQRECIIAAMKNPSGFSTLTRDKPPETINAEVETKSTAPNRQIYSLSRGDRGHHEENGNPAQPANAASLLQPTGAYQFNGATENADKVHQIPAAPGQPEAIYNQDQQKIRCSLPKTDTPTHLMNANCLQSELNTSGPVHSNVIHSEGLKNQVFPHEAVGTATLVTQTQGNLDAMVEGLEISPKKVQKCHECQGEIRVGDVAVIAEKAKNEAWHPGCFACSVCNELLVDLVYFYYKGKLYCGRDLATFLGIPRCFACDELIFVREYTVAEGHNYHVEHFCCWDCDVPLAGQKYISENDRPLCLMCYQKTYAETCNACNVVIAADQQGVAIKNLNFHATEACFCCVICKKNLLNSRMAIKEGKLFCSKECISVFGNQSSST